MIFKILAWLIACACVFSVVAPLLMFHQSSHNHPPKQHHKHICLQVWAATAVSKQLQSPADEIGGKFPSYLTGAFLSIFFKNH